MAVGLRGNIGQGQRWAFPQNAGRALADRVQTFDVQRVATGAQADGAMIVAHGVARRSANLGEGGPVLAICMPSMTRRAPSRRHQVKGVAAIGGDVDEAIPRSYITCEALGIGMEVRRIAVERSESAARGRAVQSTYPGRSANAGLGAVGPAMGPASCHFATATIPCAAQS